MYLLPPIELLDAAPDRERATEGDQTASGKLVSALERFNITAQVERVITGPVVTTYYLRLMPGVRYQSVVNLTNNICLALEAETARVSRIEGTPYVGVEVSRKNREVIRLREVINAEFFDADSDTIIALGKSIDGKSVILDIADAPHMLVAGATGSGKSVWLHSMLVSILYRTFPGQVRLALIDPKRVEFMAYAQLPHLLYDIATEPRVAILVLDDILSEIHKRYEILAAVGMRNLIAYRELATQPWLPYIVLVIDEFADLIMANKAVEDLIVRIAQLGRAAGVHLVLATPVVTGLIKANIETRIAFRQRAKQIPE